VRAWLVLPLVIAVLVSTGGQARADITLGGLDPYEAPDPYGQCGAGALWETDSVSDPDSGTYGYTVPGGGGVITSWSTSQQPAGAKLRLVITWPVDGAYDTYIVAKSAVETISEDTVANTFATSIPVAAGERITLDSVAGDVIARNCVYDQAPGPSYGDIVSVAPDQADVGQEAPYNNGGADVYYQSQANIQATLDTTQPGAPPPEVPPPDVSGDPPPPPPPRPQPPAPATHHLAPPSADTSSVTTGSSPEAGSLAGSDGPPASAGRFERYVASAARCPHASSARATLAVQRPAMRCLINYARSVRGLGGLTFDSHLARAARLKIGSVLRCQDFRHNACGQSWTVAFRRAGYIRGHRPYAVAENLAFAPRAWCSPRAVMRLWLLSRAHRTNIFNPSWHDAADAVRFGRLEGEPVAVWAADFGRRG
jgi:uncharacterized protein YkwD